MGLLARLLAKEVRPTAPVDSRGGWFPLIREAAPGYWQRDLELTPDTALAFSAVYSCVTLISNDIGKLRQTLQEQDADGIWSETFSPAYSPVLRKPNRYQNHIQFKEWWLTSKLIHGNVYALKQRDNRGVVIGLYVLDPTRTLPLVTPDGAVFYQLGVDNLTGIQATGMVVPASEIIHDRMNCLFHPLVGTSPIFAAALAAHHGLRIQRDSSAFFQQSANPGGVLTAPGAIAQETADRLKKYWDENFRGSNAGKVAVLGDGLKFEAMRMTSRDAQLIEQLKWTAETVCSVFHVPPYKISVGPLPSYNNIEALQQEYYSTCLQTLIENYEECLDYGLGLNEKIEGRQLGVELDIDGLLRMDSNTLMATMKLGIDGSILSPNEARYRMNLKPKKGGDSPMAQQQQYSLAALAERDQDKPFSKPAPGPSATPANAPAPDVDDEEDEGSEAREFVEYLRRGLEELSA